MKKNVLLLNLPWKQKYLREYFCSKISKAKYYYPPLDLLYISWRFDENKYNLFFLDAIAEWYESTKTVEYIADNKIDIVYFLASAASFNEDKEFLNKFSSLNLEIIFIWIGDIFRELREKSFDLFPLLNAINLNFSWDQIINYLEKPDWQVYDNVVYKYWDKIIAWNEVFPKWKWIVPVPRLELVKKELYNHPFAIRQYSTVMLTDFGCPFNCQFCPMSNIDHSYRDLETVITEIKELKKQWINDIFFIDQTFWMNVERTKEICKVLKEQDISWCCFNRVDNVSEEKIKLMKDNWCYAMIFWIETTNEAILKEYKKNTKIDQMLNSFSLCKKYWIRIAGTFIIWLPWETKESMLSTIQFSKKLNLDFASFNIATPRIWTNFRTDMIKLWWANPKELNLDSAKQIKSSWEKHEISHIDLINIQQFANKSFYLRPSYLLKRLFNLKSFYELKNSIIEAYYLLIKK